VRLGSTATALLVALTLAGVGFAQGVEVRGVSFNTDHHPDGVWIYIDLAVSDRPETLKVLAWVHDTATGAYIPNPNGGSAYQDADDDLMVSDTQSAADRSEPFWLYLPYDQLPAGEGSYYLQVVVRPDGATDSLANVSFDQKPFTATGGASERRRIAIETIEQGAVTEASGENRPFAFVFGDYDLGAGRLHAEALITGGIGENPSVTSAMGSWVYEDRGRYRLSADLYWSGYLSGAGIAGAGTGVRLSIVVYDSDLNPIARSVVHEREIRESYITVGGLHDQGDETALLTFDVTNDDGYFISFELTCEAEAGVLSFDVYCLYGSGLTGDHTVLAGYAGVSRAEVERLD
jgi:hypothetical protein